MTENKINKFKNLFDSFYFVNIDLFLKIIFRYKKHVSIILFFTVTSLGYIYLNQSNIYVKQVRFRFRKIETQKTSDVKFDLLKSVKGESVEDDQEQFDRLKSLISSWEFKQKVLQFFTLKENSSLLIGRGNDSLSAKKLARICKNELECITRKFSKIISKMYKVKKNIDSDDFTFLLTGSDQKTIEFLFPRFKEFILNTLKEDEVEYLGLKSSLVQKMIKEKESLVKEKDIKDLSKKILTFETKLETLGSEILEIQTLYNKEFRSKNEVELKLKYLLKNVNKVGSSEVRDKEEEYKQVEQLIVNYQQNISLLKEDSDSASNKKVIGELQKEIKILKLRISNSKRSRNISSFENYQKNSESLPELEVKKSVLADSIKRISLKLKEKLFERTSLLKDYNKIKYEVKLVEPIEEAIIELRKRLEFIEFKKSTIIAPVNFYKELPFVDQFKSHSLKKLVFLGLIFLFFTLLIFLGLFYTFDDKVYNISEFNNVFDEDIEVIGQAVVLEK